MKKLFAALLAALMAVSMTACGTQTTNSESGTASAESTQQTEKLKIGILQLVEHSALDEARGGFIQALSEAGFRDGENIEIDFQNAQADQSNLLTMSQRFVNNKSDLVLAIATGAAQSIASQTKDIPILFTAVTDPVSAGLVESNEVPGGNVSGTNDMSPIAQQIDLIIELAPNTQTIGILFNSSEDNSVLQAEIAKQAIEERGLKAVEQTVTNSNEVQQATQSLVTKCDAVYVPTDNTIASSMAIVAQITKEAKIPVICGEENPVKEGGLATLGLNYFNLGFQTGKMAVRILNGEDISTMAVESQTDFTFLINKETAEAIGIEIPARLQAFVQ